MNQIRTLELAISLINAATFTDERLVLVQREALEGLEIMLDQAKITKKSRKSKKSIV